MRQIMKLHVQKKWLSVNTKTQQRWFILYIDSAVDAEELARLIVEFF